MKLLLFILVFGLTIVSCNKDPEAKNSDCPSIVLANNTTIDSLIGFILSDSIRIEDNCLIVRLGFSGCDSDHEFDLLTTGDLAYSDPPLMSLYFRDNKPQACQAYFTKEYSYDLDVIDSIIGNATKVRLYFPWGSSLQGTEFLYEK